MPKLELQDDLLQSMFLPSLSLFLLANIVANEFMPQKWRTPFWRKHLAFHYKIKLFLRARFSFFKSYLPKFELRSFREYIWGLCHVSLISSTFKIEHSSQSERKRRDSFGMFDGYDSCSEDTSSSSSSEESEEEVAPLPSNLPIIKNNGQVYTYPDGKSGMGEYQELGLQVNSLPLFTALLEGMFWLCFFCHSPSLEFLFLFIYFYPQQKTSL